MNAPNPSKWGNQAAVSNSSISPGLLRSLYFFSIAKFGRFSHLSYPPTSFQSPATGATGTAPAIQGNADSKSMPT